MRVSKREAKTKTGKNVAIICLVTDEGFFSNFESVWKKQGIDISKVKEGDPIEVLWKDSNGFKNFVKVMLVDSRDINRFCKEEDIMPF